MHPKLGGSVLGASSLGGSRLLLSPPPTQSHFDYEGEANALARNLQ